MPDPSIGAERIDRRVPGRCRSVRAHDLVIVNRDPEVKIFLEKVIRVGELSGKWFENATEASGYLEVFMPGLLLVSVECAGQVEDIGELRGRVAPGLSVMAVGVDPSRDLVVKAMAAGAHDFLFAEGSAAELSDKLAKLLRGAGRACSVGEGESPGLERVELICESDRMKKIISLGERVAASDATILIQGESGTGKEVFARHIHQNSQRAGKCFVAINCGALPESLLESELFGHERGAFTGALDRRQGLFEMAGGGTVFLDEVGEMTPAMQVKVLRVLQSREFRRLGGTKLLEADVRILAASNKDLRSEVREGRFRIDLFYRLNVVTLELPPLRERCSDIPGLVAHFSRRLAVEMGLKEREFSPRALETLAGLHWEGNVRELENLVERLLLLCDRMVISTADITEHLQQEISRLPEETAASSSASLDEAKRAHVSRVLHANGGNKMKTARQLDINVKTLYNLIRRRGIGS
ncbi:MAG: sigma-54 dependent transcriptional regulator [Planctomycetes bacterium]|nr:sigma-54 dependent transcriptional regulator [Planctomycetota bacterium]